MRQILKITSILMFQTLGAQNGTWTWMKGDNVPNQPGVYGTQGVSSPINKPPSTYEGAEWKDFAGNFWLYDYNDLWKFNPITLEWTWIKGTQGVDTYGVYGTKGISSNLNHPGRHFCSASWVDNIGNLWLFGGIGLNGHKNDLWKYNISINEWTWMKGDSTGNSVPQFGTKGIANPTNCPGGIYETSTTWVDSNNNLWLFGGGFNGGGLCWNTLWKYKITSNEWVWMSGDNFTNAPANYGVKGVPNTNNKPSARLCYSRWIKNDTLWLFGGRNNLGATLNDLWQYSIPSNTWTWISGSDTTNNKGIYISKCVSSVNRLPYSRFETRACWKDINGIFWLYGGLTSAPLQKTFNDLWTYNSNLNKWTWVSGDSIPSSSLPNYGTIQVPNAINYPGSRSGAVSWIDNFNNLWVFGGDWGPLNDLWKYDINESCGGTYLGVKEFDFTSKFFIYPLPFENTISIEFELNNSSDIKISLRNLQGQILKTFIDKSNNKNHKIKCDVKDLNLLNGIYVLDIICNQKTVTRKVIKLDK